jgi:hypothetical protein
VAGAKAAAVMVDISFDIGLFYLLTIQAHPHFDTVPAVFNAAHFVDCEHQAHLGASMLGFYPTHCHVHIERVPQPPLSDK